MPRQACELALQPDGGILAAVDSNIAGIRLVRWTPDGNVDTGFGTEGYAEIRVPGAPTIRQWTSALAVLPDGSIVAAGGATAANEPARYVVAARFGADGSLDTTFGNQGGLIDDLGGTAADMVVRPDGRILVTGTVEHRYSSNGEAQMFLAQYGGTGARDTTFGNRGVAHAVDDGRAKGVTLLEDGKVLVVGGEYPDANGPDPHDGFILLRYLADGSLDDEFGQHGISTTDRVDGAESAVAAAEQADGRLVVVGMVPHPGRSQPDVGIYRFRV